MSLSNIKNRESVIRAIEECDCLGREAFLEKYGYGKAKRYYLVWQDKYYDSKAIIGVAHKYECPNYGPLTSEEFSGGENTVQKKLEELGFRVQVKPPTKGKRE